MFEYCMETIQQVILSCCIVRCDWAVNGIILRERTKWAIQNQHNYLWFSSKLLVNLEVITSANQIILVLRKYHCHVRFLNALNQIWIIFQIYLQCFTMNFWNGPLFSSWRRRIRSIPMKRRKWFFSSFWRWIFDMCSFILKCSFIVSYRKFRSEEKFKKLRSIISHILTIGFIWYIIEFAQSLINSNQIQAKIGEHY